MEFLPGGENAESLNESFEKGSSLAANRLLEESGLQNPPDSEARKAGPQDLAKNQDKTVSKPEKAQAGDLIPGRFIVSLKEEPGIRAAQKLDSLLAGLKLDPRNQPDTVIYRHALNGFSAQLTAAQKQSLENDPAVEFIEQDRVVSRPQVQRHSLLAAPHKELPTGVKRIDGHLSKTANSGTDVDVDIAVIDTGINLKHPDLNVVKDKSFVPGARSGDDDDGHGSHVAGIIAARKDGHGIVGVAPGARLWALKVLDKDGNGSWSQIIAAIDYVTEHAKEIEVVNMSLGDSDKSEALNRAITRSVDSGVTYIVAAGNDAQDASKETPSDHPRVLAVSAIADGNGRGGGGFDPKCEPDEVDDTFATFSNFGKNVKIAAPGVCIESASMRQGKNADRYEVMSGTSMAAPHVAGAAGLLKARHPNYNPDKVMDTLIKNGKKQSDPVYGFSGDKDGYAEPLLNVKDL